MNSIDTKTIKELKELCKKYNIKSISNKRKNELIILLNQHLDNELSNDITNININDIKKYNVLDLFCGCGGMSNGFNKIFNVVCGVDVWDIAIQSYKANNKNHIALCKDLVSFEPKELNDILKGINIDIIIKYFFNIIFDNINISYRNIVQLFQ